ncbi:site-specific integrase [Micrococcaceae bacterium Sec5.1]
MPKVRALSPKTIEAYRISLECYVDYLIGVQHIERKDIGFEHFERRFIKAWLSWMQQTKNYQPKTVNLRMTAIKAFLHYTSSEDLRLVAPHDATKALMAPPRPKYPSNTCESTKSPRSSRPTTVPASNRCAIECS